MDAIEGFRDCEIDAMVRINNGTCAGSSVGEKQQARWCYRCGGFCEGGCLCIAAGAGLYWCFLLQATVAAVRFAMGCSGWCDTRIDAFGPPCQQIRDESVSCDVGGFDGVLRRWMLR